MQKVFMATVLVALVMLASGSQAEEKFFYTNPGGWLTRVAPTAVITDFPRDGLLIQVNAQGILNPIRTIGFPYNFFWWFDIDAREWREVNVYQLVGIQPENDWTGVIAADLRLGDRYRFVRGSAVNIRIRVVDRYVNQTFDDVFYRRGWSDSIPYNGNLRVLNDISRLTVRKRAFYGTPTWLLFSDFSDSGISTRVTDYPDRWEIDLEDTLILGTEYLICGAWEVAASFQTVWWY